MLRSLSPPHLLILPPSFAPSSPSPRLSIPQASASETTPGRRASRVKRTTPVRTSKAPIPAAPPAAAAAPFPPEGGCPPVGQQRPSRTAAAASGTTGPSRTATASGTTGRYVPDAQAEAQAVASLHKEAGNTSFQSAKYEQVWTWKGGEVNVIPVPLRLPSCPFVLPLPLFLPPRISHLPSHLSPLAFRRSCPIA